MWVSAAECPYGKLFLDLDNMGAAVRTIKRWLDRIVFVAQHSLHTPRFK